MKNLLLLTAQIIYNQINIKKMKNIDKLFPGPALFIIKNELVTITEKKLTISKDTLNTISKDTMNTIGFVAAISIGVTLWVQYHRSL